VLQARPKSLPFVGEVPAATGGGVPSVIQINQ